MVPSKKLDAISVPRLPQIKAIREAWRSMAEAKTDRDVEKKLIILDRELLLSYIED